jgi:hypothetical protein
MKLTKEKRDQIILISMITIGLCFGLWHFVIKTRSAQITAERERFEQEERRLHEARNWIERAQTIMDELDSATTELIAREDRLASPTDTFGWSLLFLDRTRQGHAIEIVDVKRPQVGSVRFLPQFPYRAATFTVNGQAHYHDFGRFLADFENRHPYFRVENIELSRRTGSGSDGAQAPGPGGEMLSIKMDIVALLRPSE